MPPAIASVAKTHEPLSVAVVSTAAGELGYIHSKVSVSIILTTLKVALNAPTAKPVKIIFSPNERPCPGSINLTNLLSAESTVYFVAVPENEARFNLYVIYIDFILFLTAGSSKSKSLVS